MMLMRAHECAHALGMAEGLQLTMDFRNGKPQVWTVGHTATAAR